jgi:hypothetical protein
MTMENVEMYDSKIIDGVENNDVNELEVGKDELKADDVNELEVGKDELKVDEDENCPELINNWSSGRNISFHPSDGIISPMDRYNIYGNAIRCMKCDSLYHVQKDCKSTL